MKIVNLTINGRIVHVSDTHTFAKDDSLTIEIGSFLKLPQREWVSLTDDEIAHWFGAATEGSLIAFARAIEAKLKEKNT